MHEQTSLLERQVARGDPLEQRGANEQWMWHGTTNVKPMDICRDLDGVDCRMVHALGCIVLKRVALRPPGRDGDGVACVSHSNHVATGPR